MVVVVNAPVAAQAASTKPVARTGIVQPRRPDGSVAPVSKIQHPAPVRNVSAAGAAGATTRSTRFDISTKEKLLAHMKSHRCIPSS